MFPFDLVWAPCGLINILQVILPQFGFPCILENPTFQRKTIYAAYQTLACFFISSKHGNASWRKEAYSLSRSWAVCLSRLYFFVLWQASKNWGLLGLVLILVTENNNKGEGVARIWSDPWNFIAVRSSKLPGMASFDFSKSPDHFNCFVLDVVLNFGPGAQEWLPSFWFLLKTFSDLVLSKIAKETNMCLVRFNE